jgi:SAM-dependent methyltransferase
MVASTHALAQQHSDPDSGDSHAKAGSRAGSRDPAHTASATEDGHIVQNQQAMQGHQHEFNEPEAYAGRWEDPERDAWQRPQGLVDALDLEPGMSVADIGTGTGYLLPYLSQAVGSGGLVYAVDVSPNMLEWVRERAARESLDNVSTVAAGGARTGLASHSVDRAIMINVWHHVEQPEAYAADLLRSLRPGGRLFIVESRPDSNEADGPPAHYRMSAQAVIKQLEQAGFTAALDAFQIDRQYVVRAER